MIQKYCIYYCDLLRKNIGDGMCCMSCSKQETIGMLTKEDGISLQRLNFYRGNIHDALFYPSIEDVPSDVTILAVKDGLNLKDWIAWFKDVDLSKPFAIIHFTKFRY